MNLGPILLVKKLSLLCFCLLSWGSNATIIQTLHVDLKPESSQITASGTIGMMNPISTTEFWLNKNLQIRPCSNCSLKVLSSSGLLIKYHLQLKAPSKIWKLKYSGVIPSLGQEGISSKGVALFPSMGWHPIFDHQDYLYDLFVTTPVNWLSMSHDKIISEQPLPNSHLIHWASRTPQEEIYLLANKWKRYERDFGQYMGYVYLLEDNQQLADSFLDNTGRSIKMYENLIGPYPYKQMATVENYWETGYGMPSFTLLGSQVLRLPFIQYTSFPHEILHNWWGNGVFVDWDKGNWSEGLTSYMADHYFQTMRGTDHSYRRSALLNYSVFAQRGSDFPLKDFRSRFDKSSSAVGYSKGLMFFHMLKTQLGEKHFSNGLRYFYNTHKFSTASFSDLLNSFEYTSGEKLEKFFDQWVNYSGAPTLKFHSAHQAKASNGTFKVSLKIGQTQTTPIYKLKIPVHFKFTDSTVPKQTLSVNLASSKEIFIYNFKHKVHRVIVDPHFDVFRYLYQEEIPDSVSKLFGQHKITLVLPSKSPIKNNYLDWARAIQQHFKGGVTIVWDHEVSDSIPSANTWVLGAENLKISWINAAAQPLGLRINGPQVTIKGQTLNYNKNTIFASLAHPDRKNLSLAWLTAPTTKTLSRSAQKIPHYGKYSFLGFVGEKNILKGEWPILTSPLIYELN